MAQFRDFDADAQAGEPITFRLAGETWSTVPEIPAGVVFDLARVASADGAEAFQAFADFMDAIIDPAQVPAFQEVVRTRVSLRTLMEVVRWVMQEAAATPFTQP